MSRTPSAIRIYKGLSIYRVANSPNWQVRIWNKKTKKYMVKSTGFDSSIKAREAAQELALSLLKQQKPVEPEFQFRTYAIKLLHKSSVEAKAGEKSVGYMKSMQWAIQNADWGLMDWFGEQDIRKLRTQSYLEYISHLKDKRPDLASSTLNTLMSTFRNVLKIARDEGVIDFLPSTPRPRGKDNPRPFFRFHPLVSKENDSYKKLRNAAKEMADQGVVVRGTPVTEELYDLILFLTQSFVRPITTELYALRHRDIVEAEEPNRLIVTISNGKTGYRTANTMEGAVSVYKRICLRQPNRTEDTYLFLPEYKNRTTASKVIQRQFKELLKRTDLETDKQTGNKHRLYSLRHTAICMRIILSHGKVNIFNLAKNAGTSVDQIERFYAKFLPLSKEMAINLQTFGGQD